MQNINPSKNVNRRGRFYAFMGLFIFFMGLIAIALGVLFTLLPLLGPDFSTPAAICMGGVGILMTPVGIILMFRGWGLKKDNMLAYEVGEAMRHFLTDPRFRFIRNVSRRRLGYIDAVLVGPPGALVFRTVDYTGEWVNERAEWRVRSRKGRLQTASSNPTRECARDVYALRKFLAKRSLKHVPVYGVVVFVNRVKLRGQGPVIPIAEKDMIYRILRDNYLAEERINSSQIRATVDAIIE